MSDNNSFVKKPPILNNEKYIKNTLILNNDKYYDKDPNFKREVMINYQKGNLYKAFDGTEFLTMEEVRRYNKMYQDNYPRRQGRSR